VPPAEGLAAADGEGDDVADGAALDSDPTGNADACGVGTTDEAGAHEAATTPTTNARRSLTRASCRIRPSSICGSWLIPGDESAFDSIGRATAGKAFAPTAANDSGLAERLTNRRP